MENKATSATFRFFGSLNDFLPRVKRNVPNPYTFRGNPSVKDAIEALGVPHPEVDLILVKDQPVTFGYLLQAGDEIAVHPAGVETPVPEDYFLRPPIPAVPGIILDVHLGKLAKALRLFGFDTLYRNNYHDQEIAQLAAGDNRVVLTRDVGLLKQKLVTYGYWLRSQQLEPQLQEVLRYFNLQDKYQPFTRCLDCNGNLETVSKAEIVNQLPPKTKMYFEKFFRCTNCQKVYWQGSHFDRMQQFVAKFKG